MEKKGKTTIYGVVADNVLPFVSKPTIDDKQKYADAVMQQKKKQSGEFLEKEVDVLVCSLCGSNQFFLVDDEQRTVGCCKCGYLTSTHWVLPDGQ